MTSPEIRELAERYAALVDARDFTGAAALFADDGELHTPGQDALGPLVPYVGRPEVERALSFLSRVAATHHEVGGVLVSSGPGATTGIVTGSAHHYTGGPGDWVDTVWRVGYHDVYAPPAGGRGWRIARREVVVRAVERHAVEAVRTS